ncbi:hypothetical protein V6N11_042890 [Hibiscus sabdariffa]|uniref:KIB1-4 beta-propeller domain-containing protein n=1 Tax=Hibiscus sabdariffa TaxID=183260 RepID=A0ABR2QXR5_9ROSI
MLPLMQYHWLQDMGGQLFPECSLPKCVIFLLGSDSGSPIHKIHVTLCSPGDHSWRTLEFKSGIGPGEASCAPGVAYANGVFYCLFLQGQLGAFNVELEEWSILGGSFPPTYFSFCINLFMIDADIWVFDQYYVRLYRFDFSKMRWVYENNLNNHALFIGCSSFAVPTVGEISELANTIISLDMFSGRRLLWPHMLYKKVLVRTPPQMFQGNRACNNLDSTPVGWHLDS